MPAKLIIDVFIVETHVKATSILLVFANERLFIYYHLKEIPTT